MSISKSNINRTSLLLFYTKRRIYTELNSYKFYLYTHEKNPLIDSKCIKNNIYTNFHFIKGNVRSEVIQISVHYFCVLIDIITSYRPADLAAISTIYWKWFSYILRLYNFILF